MLPFNRARSLVRNRGSALIMSALTLVCAALASPSFAQFNGAQKLTFSGGNIFSLSGNTVTVTSDSTPTYISKITGNPTWTNRELLGINGLWVVDGDGNILSGIGVTANGGYVYGATQTPQTVTWTASNSSDPDGYNDPAPGNGFKMNGDGTWLQLAPDSHIPGTGTPSGYTIGYFTFTGLDNYIQTHGSLNGLYLGIDYLVLVPPDATATGRGYGLVSFEDLTNVVTPVPEPGVMVFAGMFTTTLGGQILRVRKRRNANQTAI
jgi:hypothetical protein